MSCMRVLSEEEHGEWMLSSPRWFRFSSSGVWRDLPELFPDSWLSLCVWRESVAFIIIFLRVITSLLDGHLSLLEFVLGGRNPPGSSSRRRKAHLLGHGPRSQESCLWPLLSSGTCQARAGQSSWDSGLLLRLLMEIPEWHTLSSQMSCVP